MGDFELALRWSGTVGTRGFFDRFAGSSWSPAFSLALVILILMTSVEVGCFSFQPTPPPFLLKFLVGEEPRSTRPTDCLICIFFLSMSLGT